MNILDAFHIIGGLAPNADAFAGTKATDIFEVAGEGAAFIYWMGTNDDNAFSVITVLACDDIAASSTHAVAFKYRACTTIDTWGAWTEATTAGFSTAQTSDNIYLIWVDAAEIAHIGYKYVKLQAVEGDDHPVDGVVVAMVVNTRYQGQPQSLID
jgi:hypothetical protein